MVKNNNNNNNNTKFLARDKYQTIKEILTSLPGRQTHLMYKARLGYYQTIYLLKILQEAQLINGRNRSGIFSITEKGERYLYLLEQRSHFFD